MKGRKEGGTPTGVIVQTNSMWLANRRTDSVGVMAIETRGSVVMQ